MSQKRLYPIACPQCRHEKEVELYDAINVGEEAYLREELMGNRLNTVTCESCGLSFRVDKPLLYHDPVNEFMIYCIPVSEANHEEGQRLFRDSLGSITQSLPEEVSPPPVHLVFSRIELVERVFLLEAQLDERLIEYVKYMIYSKNMAQVDPARKILLFNAEDSNEENLCFVIQDADNQQLEGMLQYSRSAYTALEEMFDQDDQTPNLLEIFPGPYINARALLNDQRADTAGEPAGDSEAD